MAAINKLTTLKLKTSQKGRYSDGGGLYLNVTSTGTKSWLFIWKGKRWVTDNNRSGRREMGLGKFGDEKSGFVSLKRARELAADCRTQVEAGIDPQRKRVEDRDRTAPKTFGEVGHEFIDRKEKKWRNPKHRQQWRMTIDSYCQSIKRKPVVDISQTDVLKVIEPLWATRHETARRVLGRISNILSYAIAKEMRLGPNPAEWKGRIEFLVEEISPELKQVKHHAALDYNLMPVFVERVRGMDALAAKALLLLIFSAARTSEVLNAQWDEFAIEDRLWIIPGERMKLRKPHAVPLPDVAIEILNPLFESRTNDFVFAGQKPNRPLSNMSMLMLLRRHKIEDVTPHGMRASFRSWAHDKTSFDPRICEQALAHRNPDKVEAAYLRSTGFDKRRALMQAWADYCMGKFTAEVLDFGAARNG